jgi:formate-nitrite transporter family protein
MKPERRLFPGRDTSGADGGTTLLRETEVRQVEKRTAPRAAVIYEAIRAEGEDELVRPSSALFWSGLAAGLSMGFSLVAEGLLHSYIPDLPWRPLVTKFGYSIGFLIVILGRQQLFTENTLTPILPFLRKPERNSLLQVLRLWAVVLAANMTGAFIFAATVAHSGIFDEQARTSFGIIGREAMQGDFSTIFLRGVFAGWLIALMVWLLPFAETSRIWVIIIITYLVGIAKLSHIVAGSVEAFYVVVTGGVPWGHLLGTFMIPTLLGNILGGVALVAVINHGQVVAGNTHSNIDP